MYVFTSDPTRCASEIEVARFVKDCEPPPRGSAAPAASGAEGFGPNGAITISGAYEARVSVRGAAEGAYGFFRRLDGAVIVCSWTAADGGSWVDIGEMQDSEAGNAAEAGGKQWDYTRGVSMDTPTGTRTLKLTWNEVRATLRGFLLDGVPVWGLTALGFCLPRSFGVSLFAHPHFPLIGGRPGGGGQVFHCCPRAV